MLSNCGHDENNRYHGGKPGDQTGEEWRLCNWYDKTWHFVLRHPDPKVREMMATMAEQAAENDLIGYNQDERTTFWKHLQASAYNPSQITIPCNADCSSGVAAIAKATGYRLGIDALRDLSPDIYTGNEKEVFEKAGFTVLTDPKYRTSDQYLIRGDVLLAAHHTVINVTNGRLSGGSSSSCLEGIDVSKWQGDIDWAKVKASGVQFAILRAGHGVTEDPKFEQNYFLAKAAGIPIGAYWYCEATSAMGVNNEAASMIRILSDKSLEYPVYYDIEEQENLEAADRLTSVFCQKMEDAGWYAGFYTSLCYIDHFSQNIRNRYCQWMASWGSSKPYTNPGIWQYSSKGKINGIDGYVDLDRCYVGYPAVIAGAKLNHSGMTLHKEVTDAVIDDVIAGKYGNGDTRIAALKAAGYDPTEIQNGVNSRLKQASLDKVVKEVIAGKWGSGADRKRKLTEAGYNYREVQNEVNKRLKGA